MYPLEIYCQGGIEPTARSLEGCCSIQLSYWRKYGSDNL